MYSDPSGISEVITTAWRLYRKYFLQILLFVLLVYIPMNVSLMFIPDSYVQAVDGYVAAIMEISESGSMDGLASIDVAATLPYLLSCFAIFAVFRPLLVGAAAYIANEESLGREATFNGIMKNTVYKWHKLFLTYAAYIILVYFFAPLIIPAVYFGIVMFFSTYTVNITQNWGPRALWRSAGAVKGSFLKTAGAVILFAVLDFFASFFLQGFVSAVGLGNNLITGVVAMSAAKIPSMLFLLCFAVFYIRLLEAKEDYTG